MKLIRILLAVALAAWVGSAVIAAPALEIVEAVVNGKWSDVERLTDHVTQDEAAVALRVVRAHALLALNRNDESLELFLSAAGPESLEEWDNWTAALGRSSGPSVITHYLRGDAAARAERWDVALLELDAGLRLEPFHPLLLNARGAVQAAVGSWDEALRDLTAATVEAPELADAHAAVGAMWIQRRAAPEAALESFEEALRLSDGFAIAHLGKGCAEYVLGRWEIAGRSIAAAGHALSSLPRAHAIVEHDLQILRLGATQAKFPYFSHQDFIDWPRISNWLHDPSTVLFEYFAHRHLPQELNDDVIGWFNELLEIGDLYDRSASEFDDVSRPAKPRCQESIQPLLSETRDIRKRALADMKDIERERVRKLNRLLVECSLPDAFLELALNEVDRPGFSLERGVGFVDSMSTKSRMTNHELTSGLNRMNDIYRPMADTLSSVKIVGGVGKMWNRHLDNQIGINNDILKSRGVDYRPGGVDFSMRRARVESGDWGVGTWFGLGYAIEPREPQVLVMEGE